MAEGWNSSNFGTYLSTWPRLTAFKRPTSQLRSSRSFMIEDILRRDETVKPREQPNFQPPYSTSVGHNTWNACVPAHLPLYRANFETFNNGPANPRLVKPTVICPMPKYFRNFLEDSRRFRRTRTVFTRGQLLEMEQRFGQEKYLSTNGRNDFARQLKLTPLQVKTWFQNRRMKWKKEMLKKDPKAVTTRAKGRPKKDEF